MSQTYASLEPNIALGRTRLCLNSAACEVSPNPPFSMLPPFTAASQGWGILCTSLSASSLQFYATAHVPCIVHLQLVGHPHKQDHTIKLKSLPFLFVYPLQLDCKLPQASITSDMTLLSFSSAWDGDTQKVSRCTINVSEQSKLWGWLIKIV